MEKRKDELTKEEINALHELAEVVHAIKKDENKTLSKSETEEHYEDILSAVTAEIFGIRYKRNITQAQLAKMANKDQAQISRTENLSGDDPSIKTLVEIFYALGHKFYMTPYGEYTYTIPEEYRECISEIAAEKKLSLEEFIEDFFTDIIGKVHKRCKGEQEDFDFNIVNSRFVDPTKSYFEFVIFNEEERTRNVRVVTR
jgi:transcriptional regulator with XRE-family HTH domain